MLKNMLNSAQNVGMPMELFHCYISAEGASATYATQEFQSVTLKKLELIRANMGMDREVLWIDNDIVLFENVIEDVRSKPGHFVMQDDLWGPCTGFFLVRTSPLSLRVIDDAIAWLRSNRTNPSLNDQHAFHHALRHIIAFPKPTVTLLSRDAYPNGHVYFVEGRTQQAKMVHSNYVPTTAEKIKRFQEAGLWDPSDVGVSVVHVYSI